jgi:cobalt-zinc-cadmium efflux system membrane fusion protein
MKTRLTLIALGLALAPVWFVAAQERLGPATDTKSEAPRDPNRLWCGEHGLYEDECLICHPELAERKPAPTNKELPDRLVCKEHELFEDECGICHPELTAALRPGQGLKIRFESREAVAYAGVRTERPTPIETTDVLRAPARVRFNENRIAHLTPLVHGVIQRVLVDLGSSVAEGDALVEIASTEVSEAKRAYVSAAAEAALKSTIYEREKDLVERRISPKQDLDTAKAEHDLARWNLTMARQRLLTIGLASDEITALSDHGEFGNTLALRAPWYGTVVERHAVPGERVEPGNILFTLADLSSVWVEISLPESALASARLGSAVTAEFAAFPNRRFEGELTWIGARIDPQSRTLPARVEMSNEEGLLKEGLFGQATLADCCATAALAVPKTALQRYDKKPFVFVKLDDNLFEVREVSVAGPTGDRVAITAGIQPADEIVVAQSFTVKSEFLKARLGAGCVDD